MKNYLGEIQPELPPKLHEERKSLLHSISFMNDMKKFHEYRLALFYREHSPQLNLFEGES